jgi:hypothetical protein
MVTTTENRFKGNKPNGHASAWRVICSKCAAVKDIGGNKSKSLPPQIIIKKLTQAGWYVGNSARHDLCPQCNRKPVASHLPLAHKALTELAQPVVTDGQRQVHFSEVVSIAEKLEPQEAKQLIEVLRQRIPARPKIVRTSKPEPPDDSDYAQWLEQLEK